MVAALAAFCLSLAVTAPARAQNATAQTAAATTTPPAPVGGTTVVDRLQQRNDQPRTSPTLPLEGDWGILLGSPKDNGNGLTMATPGQAIVYPTSGVLNGNVGTIEFTVATGAADTNAHNLLDSWPNSGNARYQLTFNSGKLHLVVTDDNNNQNTIDAAANWDANSSHRIDILWDPNSLDLQSDGITIGTAAKPKLPSRPPLALVLGSDRDLQQPGNVSISSLRLSTAKEPAAPQMSTEAAAQSADEVATQMSLGYLQNIYPVLSKIQGQNGSVAAFDTAAAAADIADYDHANQALQPILGNPNDPMYVPAVFLKADILASPPTPDYQAAYDQLEVLAGSADPNTAVTAQIRQAVLLYEQGNKTDSQNLISQIIDKFNKNPAVNNAYLMVGLNQFQQGNFEDALTAFKTIGIPSAPPQQYAEIGQPIQIRVEDSDLNARVSNAVVNVTVTSSNGDKEQAQVRPAFSKGVYIGSIDTELGDPKPGDGKLQLVGGATVTISYVDDTKQERSYTVKLATPGTLAMMSQSAVDVYHEVLDLQKRNILDDNWVLVGILPKNSSDFFRDPSDGTLRRKGYQFDSSFLSNIKPGQNIYFELTAPDGDPATGLGHETVAVKTQGGQSAQVPLTETGPHTGIFAGTIKTCKASAPVAGALAVTDNDVIIGHYDDPAIALYPGRQPNPDPRMTVATQFGQLMVGMLVPDPDDSDDQRKVFLRAWRIPTGTPITVQVTDRDLDISDAPDSATVHLHASSGVDKDMTLTETGNHTGIFEGTFTVAPDQFAAKQGDDVLVTYNDEENPSGKPIQVTYDTKVNEPTNASVIFEREIVTEPTYDKDNMPAWLPPPTITWQQTKVLTPGFVYRITLSDPDQIPMTAGEFYTKITLKSSDGSVAEVPLRAGQDQTTHEITFTGDFYCRLGDAGSPPRAYFSETGEVVELAEDTDVYTLDSLPSLNVQGNDTVTANYIQPLGPDGAHDVPHNWPLTIASDAVISATDEQGVTITSIKPGTHFILQIEDADGDITQQRDVLHATITSGTGAPVPVDLTETDVHSGIFTADVTTAYSEPTPPDPKVILLAFDSKLEVSYRDVKNTTGAPIVRTFDLTTSPLQDATATMLTKVYDDPKFEVETLVRLGESLYAVGAADLAEQPVTDPDAPRTNDHLKEAAVLLQQVIDQFPSSDYVVESLFLLGKIRREEKNFDEANRLFQKVVDNYPDSDFVPQALYQQVLLHYDEKDIDAATESAMRLVYGFPQNPLVADAFLRIAEWYYDGKQFLTAAYIYRRVVERFPDNPRVPLVFYRMATAYYRAGTAGTVQDNQSLASAVKYYIEFANNYKDHELADDSLYWAATASLKMHDTKRAFTILTKSLIAYPEGDMRAYAARLRDKIKQDNPGIEADEDE